MIFDDQTHQSSVGAGVEKMWGGDAWRRPRPFPIITAFVVKTHAGAGGEVWCFSSVSEVNRDAGDAKRPHPHPLLPRPYGMATTFLVNLPLRGE